MLITNKQSNILEDLETLKLLSKVVRLTVLILRLLARIGSSLTAAATDRSRSLFN